MTVSHSDYIGALMTYSEAPPSWTMTVRDDLSPSPTMFNAHKFYGLRSGETVPVTVECKARDISVVTTSTMVTAAVKAEIAAIASAHGMSIANPVSELLISVAAGDKETLT